MKTELDSLATALYVKTDDLLKGSPQFSPWRPAVGIAPRLSDAELVTLAMMQAMLGFTSEARWLRHAHTHLRHLFPYLPKQPGYNKRLRKAAELVRRVTRALASDTTLWTDDVWVVDSTPVECGRSRETVKRSDLAGWAEYGYCASHSRFFWGLRLHLVCTLQGLPVAFALTGAKADERETLLDLLAVEPHLIGERPSQILIGDKNYFGREFERQLAELDMRLRPQGRGRARRITAVQAAAAGHRVDQRDLQGTTRSRTPPRPHTRRRGRPCPAAHPRTHRRDLAQRPHRPAGHAGTDRLRPLNPLE
ncbi:transposase IS4 family protein (plasmid) [Streptomyces violaceusniger Tu 4113]|uniref:Transposase IS4 family protein n=1 Tax=Streptomyces violaceusniger (strain Tu 4113) TaxID=653045 RepID=G2PGY6_STRV4|nr:transposase IS4 family protein [Streptomyces violaceusniger Tu 4113]